VTFETRWRCHDGSYKWLVWNAIAKPAEQVVFGWRATTPPQDRRASAAGNVKMRNDFVSFVTHQLRTPLSGIKWMLELAADTSEADEISSYIQDARESADRLIGLVNDLLDVSRLRAASCRSCWRRCS